VLTLDVQIQGTGALTFLKNSAKHTKYAIANALNQTLKDVQVAERAPLADQLHLRGKREFLLRQIAVLTFASAARSTFEGRARIGQRPGLMLSKFESGGTHQASRGPNVAVPKIGGARPTADSDVPEAYYLRTLALKSRASRAQKRVGGVGRITGNNDTFLVPNVGIYQRQGTKVVKLYSLRPFVSIPKRLNFQQTGVRVANARWPINMKAAIAYEVAREFKATTQKAFST